METGVIVNKITGEVFLKQKGAKIQLEKKIKLGVNVKCEIQTAEAAYVYVNEHSDPESTTYKGGAYLAVFPKSRIVVYTGRGFIKEVEILRGLVLVSVSEGKRVFTPTAEFQGTAWIDVAFDGRTVVANSRDTIYNRKTRRAVTLDVNQQVLVTEDTIGEPEPMDQRFYQAEKTCSLFGAIEGVEVYRLTEEKSDALLDAYLMAMKSMSEQTGKDFEKLKKEAIESFSKYKQWTKEEKEKCEHDAEKLKKVELSVASTIPINQSIKYQDIELKIISVKRDPKDKETDLLSIQIEVKNESKKQVFIFWNEETRLINEKGESFTIDDYNLETSFMESAQAKGYLFISVNKNNEKFHLQFGKKSLPKVELELDLSKINKGVD